MNITYRLMQEPDIQKVIPLYINYYNTHDGDQWTEETVYKRIYQVLAAPDAYCLIAEHEETVIGFVMGQFNQYYDLAAYHLVEIIIDGAYQNRGLGTALLLELERQVKEKGAAMVQLEAINDDFHTHFYGKLNYKDATNLVLKTKWL